jgi:hypothetical protein
LSLPLNWQFFRDINFTGPASNVFGPGRFNWWKTLGFRTIRFPR